MIVSLAHYFNNEYVTSGSKAADPCRSPMWMADIPNTKPQWHSVIALTLPLTNL